MSWMEFIRRTIKSWFPSSPKVLKTEWDKELEDLKEFAQGEAVRYRPESLQELVRATKFTAKEIQMIYRGFKENCPNGMVTRENFKEMFSYFFVMGDPDDYADYVFETFDMDKNGIINFDEFVQGLSVISRGTAEEKMEWIFDLYDIRKNGCISWAELRAIIQSISDMLGVQAQPPATSEVVDAHTDAIFQKLDADRDGEISRGDFMAACRRDPTILQSLSVFETVFSSPSAHHAFALS